MIGTVRRPEDAEAFEGLGARALSRLLDVSDQDAVFATVAEIERQVGAIDVAVANAGYGLEGTIEESTMNQLRDQFEVNVFGAVATMKAVLSYMRERRRGRIITVTSMGGLRTFPGLGAYHASKYALEAISETLDKEVAQFGVRVTAIEPGGFRTDWAGRSMTRVQNTIPDYRALIEPLRERRAANSGRQIGDPDKAGQALLAIVAAENPPRPLMLGSDAIELVNQAREELRIESEAWRDLSLSTDFADE